MQLFFCMFLIKCQFSLVCIIYIPETFLNQNKQEPRVYGVFHCQCPVTRSLKVFLFKLEIAPAAMTSLLYLTALCYWDPK